MPVRSRTGLPSSTADTGVAVVSVCVSRAVRALGHGEGPSGMSHTQPGALILG